MVKLEGYRCRVVKSRLPPYLQARYMTWHSIGRSPKVARTVTISDLLRTYTCPATSHNTTLDSYRSLYLIFRSRTEPHISTYNPSALEQTYQDVNLNHKIPLTHHPTSPHILSSILIKTNTPPNNPSPLSTRSTTSIPPNTRSTRITSITSIRPT